jgi:hypothetical protein
MDGRFTPSLRIALDKVHDQLAELQLELRDLDREARSKAISNRIAARQFERGGEPPVDSAESVAMTAAECIMALSLIYD